MQELPNLSTINTYTLPAWVIHRSVSFTKVLKIGAIPTASQKMLHSEDATSTPFSFLLLLLLFIYLFIINLFIFIQLQLSAFSPRPSTPPQPVPPPSPTFTLPLDFVLVSFIV